MSGRRTCTKLVIAALVAVAAALTAAGTAGAATVTGTDDGLVEFQAASGEANDVTIETTVTSCPIFLTCARSAVIKVEDTGAPVEARGWCAPTGPNSAVCGQDGMTMDQYRYVRVYAEGKLAVSLGDRDDRLVTSGEDSGWVHDGPGADWVQTQVATVVAAPGPDTISAPRMSYWARTTAVSVTVDGLWNDGAPGEGDNVASPQVEGGSGADRIVAPSAEGSAGDDHLVGRWLDGGEGADVLEADGPGDLSGGGGQDRFIGSDQDDTIRSQDWAADEIDCRGGDDAVYGDEFDRSTNCEWVFGADSIAPESRLLAPEDLSATPVVMPYTYSDPAPSDGMLHVELWVKSPGGSAYEERDMDFTYGGAGDGKLAFSPAGDGEYSAYSIAVDMSQNREAAPSTPDVTFRINRSAPSLTAHTPAAGATGVSPSMAVTLEFSEPMDKTATEQAFSLRRPDGAAIAGRFSWNATTLIFNPSKGLARSTRYTAAIGGGAKDEAGRALSNPTSWSFTTS